MVRFGGRPPDCGQMDKMPRRYIRRVRGAPKLRTLKKKVVHRLVCGIFYINMCLYPKLITNPKYKPNKRNKGNPPKPTDHRVMAVPIACGVCEECRRQKAREWTVRLNEELRSPNETPRFITMTFNDEYLDARINLDPNEIAARAIELWRKKWYKKYKKACKHWLVAELASKNTERLHLHGIIWTDKSVDETESIWGNGWVDYGEYVNEESIAYIVKYISKIDKKKPDFMTKVWTSKGIGKNYTKRIDIKNNLYNGEKTDETYRLKSGRKIQLPIYYRNKIYSEEEREKLWIHKLDKKIIYVNKMPIDISTEKGVEEYVKALKNRQKETERMGYSKMPWNKKKYKAKRENFGI